MAFKNKARNLHKHQRSTDNTRRGERGEKQKQKPQGFRIEESRFKLAATICAIKMAVWRIIEGAVAARRKCNLKWSSEKKLRQYWRLGICSSGHYEEGSKTKGELGIRRLAGNRGKGDSRGEVC